MLDSNNGDGDGHLGVVGDDAAAEDMWAWLGSDEPAPTMMRPVDEAEPDYDPMPAESIESPVPAVEEPAPASYHDPLPPAAFTRPPRSGGGWARRHRALLGALALLVLVVGGGVAGVLSMGSGQRAESATDAMNAALPSSAAPHSVVPDADCPNVTNGPVTTGRDAGSTASGPGVIKAFDYAYYVRRDGELARSYVAPTAAVGSAEQIQAAIDRLSPQTLHCLQITDTGAGLFRVQLTEQPPGGVDPVVIKQSIQTAADSSGKFSIISIKQP